MIGETGERKSAVATPDGKSRKKKKLDAPVPGKTRRGTHNTILMCKRYGKCGIKGGGRTERRIFMAIPSTPDYGKNSRGRRRREEEHGSVLLLFSCCSCPPSLLSPAIFFSSLSHSMLVSSPRGCTGFLIALRQLRL